MPPRRDREIEKVCDCTSLDYETGDVTSGEERSLKVDKADVESFCNLLPSLEGLENYLDVRLGVEAYLIMHDHYSAD